MSQASTELVSRYRSLPFPSDALGDCTINDTKANILRELDEFANEPDVSQLLLDVLAAAGEYDLARIEAAKIVWLYVKDTSPLNRQLKLQVWRIFADRNDDTLVRQHASQCFSVGFGGDAEHDIIERLLFDDEDDTAVRFGAFEYVRKARSSAFVQRLLPRLKSHPYWSQFRSSAVFQDQ